MFINRIIAIAALVILSGCVDSAYPLVTKENSIRPIEAGQYCFTRSDITIIQDSQCGWVNITLSENNGYQYKISRDSHEYVTGKGSALHKNKNYYARIMNKPVASGPLKGWSILQSCSSKDKCMYFALKEREKGIFSIALTSSPKNAHAHRAKTLAQLEGYFAKTAPPGRILTFYAPEYLDKKRREKEQKAQETRDNNMGDL